VHFELGTDLIDRSGLGCTGLEAGAARGSVCDALTSLAESAVDFVETLVRYSSSSGEWRGDGSWRDLRSPSLHTCMVFRRLASEADRAAIRTPLCGLPPPGIIFAPGRWSPVLVWLQTADHIRLASPMQEKQGAPAPGDRTGIMGHPVCEQVEIGALGFADQRRWRVSVLLSHTDLLFNWLQVFIITLTC
jgi:hypothetical protein